MNENIDLIYALNITEKAVKRAGAIINKCKTKNIVTHTKIGHDIVSEMDIAAESEIIHYLKKYFPNHSFQSEETNFINKNKKNEYRWIIDPIDGTINYVSNLPLYSISAALQKEGKTILGVIYNPSTYELISSIKGQGSYLNKKKMQVSSNINLSTSVLSFMLTSHFNKQQISDTLKYVKNLSLLCRGLRLYVSQALELSFIASGQLDGTFSVKSRGYSAAAGALILREAGGTVTDLDGREYNNTSNSLVASNSKLHHEILSHFT